MDPDEGFKNLGFRAYASGFTVRGWVKAVSGLGFKIQGLGFRVRVQGLGFWVLGSGFKV
jgi:hypothetical protein